MRMQRKMKECPICHTKRTIVANAQGIMVFWGHSAKDEQGNYTGAYCPGSGQPVKGMPKQAQR